jgi:hypothetical protein
MPDKTAMGTQRARFATLVAAMVAGLAVICSLVLSPSAAAAGPLPTRVTADVSATSVVAGTAVTISGVVTPPGVAASRPVALELQTATGWRQVVSGSTDLSGAYTLQVPTDWYATHALRVVAPAIATADVGASDVKTVEVSPPYTPLGSPSAWKRFPTEARWNPCAVIEYRTNLRRAPKGALGQVTRAFALVHAATGLTFRRAGSTKKVPYSRGPQSKQFLPAGLVVAWTTPRVVSALAGGTAGIGGASSRSVNGGPWEYVSGGVSIDATQKLPGRKKAVRALLLHEIGHAMGLTHVGTKSQIMYPTLLRSHRDRYEAGDLAGLSAVGASQGCI